MRPSRRWFLASTASITAVALTGSNGRVRPLPTEGTGHLGPFDDLFTKFLTEHKLPGAAVAVTRGGKLAYARGFGFADFDKQSPVKPNSLFRIASLSKPITATGVMLLVDRGRMKLDEPVLSYLKLKPAVRTGEKLDPRWEKITVRHCLQHTGGWDRETKGGFDPIAVPGRISRALGLDGPPAPEDIVRYMMGRPLDFDPGARKAYSNLGFLILGRVIEAVTGQRYEPWMLTNVLGPAGAGGMVLARAVPEKRPAAEVRYHVPNDCTGTCLYPPRVGQKVPLPDGAENVEAYDAHGGWVSSAIDLVRFASALDYDRKSPLLPAAAIQEMWARPDGSAGFDESQKPLPAYYACGWNVRPVGNTGKANTWHSGLLAGLSTLLVRRWDGLNWAVLFNIGATPKNDTPSSVIDSLMHDAADAVKKWPERDLFDNFK